MSNIYRIKSARNVALCSSIAVIISIIVCASWITLRMNGSSAQSADYNQLPTLHLSGLPDSSVMLEDASSHSFDSMFVTISTIPNDYLDYIRRYSVMLINNGDRPIAAYAIKWEFEQQNGTTLISDRSFIMPRSFQVYTAQAFDDAGNTMMAVRPNRGSKLVSLINTINRFLPSSGEYGAEPLAKLRNIKWHELENSALKQINFIKSRAENCKRWSATLDLVIFTDGVAVGRDTLNNLARIKQEMDGGRDVYEDLFKEIKSLDKQPQGKSQTRPDHSKLFTTLEADTGKSEIIANKEEERTASRWQLKRTGDVRTDNYNKGKLDTIRNILIMRKSGGDEKTIDHIIKTMQSPRVQFYKELPNKQRVRVW